jgi:hypothetical protein
MKIIKVHQFIVLPLLLVSLMVFSGCINKSKENSFANLMPIPINNMNHEITLSLPIMEKGVYFPKLGDTLTLALYNNSKDLVKFPSDFGIRIYQYNNNDGDWTEIKNLGNYIPEGNRQVSPKGDNSFGQILISAFPDLPLTSDPIEIRVCVIGTIYHDGLSTNKLVGAYIDITLQP